ncbi:NAD(P)/FAD-dependent oxidoreductase [Cellulomonas soli]|uniref:Pyridine nucleotide-disulfide oxidoreductase n=1 Tax=Cellulomonas soli TaxID=931535 RepID=A0A512P9Z3_9CELL|nr:FAD-dependent oxidoreductase [Cellulomonas soli]NYI60500.1 3-phenylpropionate/trans-cinnamate dioxygenase ferredoxin reductase subunit [Cellulomonas soli]GEP68015.1 pyridine nucleotide-disulfide oxidoreductase [Cellulomonas soli]
MPARTVPQHVVVVGAGLAGAKTVEHLRARGFDGRLTLLGDEAERPYERPPLSKGYLLGSAARDEAFVHGPGWYADHDVDLRTGCRAVRLDLRAGEVLDADERRWRADAVVLATGSEPRPLGVPGADLDGVHQLRTLPDSDALREALTGRPRVAVVGGGWIGLEVAAAARQAGCEVTLLVRGPAPLLGALGPEGAELFAGLHREHGVDLRTGVEVDALLPAGTEVATGTGARRVGAVGLVGGDRVEADVVVVGIGAAPRVGLAREAGIALAGADVGGVAVDAHLRTSVPQVLAVGDIAAAEHPTLGERVRVEHWATALHQPETAAATLLGLDEPYDRLPYAFSDQYELGMEHVGHVGARGYDQVVVRGDLAGRECVLLWLRQGRVLAGTNVDVWDVVDHVEALVRSRSVVDPARLADPDVPWEELAP